MAATDARAQQQFQIYASVADASGKALTSLEPADLKVMEDGMEAKVIRAEPVNWPVKVQLLVDNGIGLGGGNIQTLKDGINTVFRSMPDADPAHYVRGQYTGYLGTPGLQEGSTSSSKTPWCSTRC